MCRAIPPNPFHPPPLPNPLTYVITSANPKSSLDNSQPFSTSDTKEPEGNPPTQPKHAPHTKTHPSCNTKPHSSGQSHTAST